MKAVRSFLAADNWLFLCINRHFRCTALDFSMSKMTHLGGAFFTICICVLLIFSDFRTSRSAAVEALLALLLSQAVVQLLKKKIGRRRPYFVLSDISVRRPLFDCSFPSGHTTAGWTLAVIFSLNFPPLSMPLIFLAAVIGFSRTYLGFHYPLDVLSGALVGGGTAYAVYQAAFFL